MSVSGLPPAALLEEIDAARADLRRMLQLLPDTRITQRPQSGDWSIYENVRHLLFAEQLHMGQVFRETPAWSPFGFTPESMRSLRKLPPPEADRPSLDEVWAEWDRIHRETTRRLTATPIEDAGRTLTRHLGHLRRHIELIDRLGRRATE